MSGAWGPEKPPFFSSTASAMTHSDVVIRLATLAASTRAVRTTCGRVCVKETQCRPTQGQSHLRSCGSGCACDSAEVPAAVRTTCGARQSREVCSELNLTQRAVCTDCGVWPRAEKRWLGGICDLIDGVCTCGSHHKRQDQAVELAVGLGQSTTVCSVTPGLQHRAK